jgi:integrase
MGSVYKRGNKLWIGYIDAAGKQRCVSSGLDVGQEREARKLLEKIEVQIAAGTAPAESGPMTVERFGERWIAERKKLGLRDVSTEEGRLRKHVYPRLGKMVLVDVRPRHLIAFFKELRTEGKLAPRTIHHVYGTLRTLFRDARVEELVDTSPCVLTKAQLGKNEDKDPEWRAGALFTREELEALISRDDIPWDRRVLYALQGVAGLRHGEAAGLRWRHLDVKARPLGRLLVAHSYDKAGTKTQRSRVVPAHVTLAAMLAEWKLRGWVELMGRVPEADDLIVPSREGAIRSRHHSRNKLIDDLARLGLRHRRGHDLRRTFITLARVDGARKDILEAVTHGPRGNIMDVYTTLPWASLCEEVAKLRVERRAGDVVPLPRAMGGDEEGEGSSTTVPTTVGQTGGGLVSKSWNRHAISRKQVVEAPGVEFGRSEDGLDTSRVVSIENGQKQGVSAEGPRRASAVSNRLTTVDCSSVVTGLEDTLKALESGQISAARLRLRRLLRLVQRG